MGEGGGVRFDSGYQFLAVSLKKCLRGDNYRRPSQLLLTRIVVRNNQKTEYFGAMMLVAN